MSATLKNIIAQTLCPAIHKMKILLTFEINPGNNVWVRKG
jgi:hypothetical protein